MSRRAYQPRLATLQVVRDIEADPNVARVVIVPAEHATAFRPKRNARLIVFLKDEAKYTLSIADARRIYGKRPV